MITIRYDKSTGEVLMISEIDAPKEGDLFVEALPPEPETKPPFYAELRVENGGLLWEIKEAPPEPEPEPEEPHKPTAEEITALRKAAYTTRVDPITCEIERLKEMGGTEEELEAARRRRAEAVAAIKSAYPYPDEEDEE